MPLERQWERQHAPLRPKSRRERRILAVLVTVLLAGVALVAFAALTQGPATPAAGCLDVTGASTMGAGTEHVCGASAAELCRQNAGRDDPFAHAVERACRDSGM
jgi:hypothetical protein